MKLEPSRRKFVNLLAAGFFLPAGPLEGEQRRLYLVAGGLWPHGEWKFPGVLFGLDEALGTVEWASTLVSQDAGLESVMYSFDNRLLLVAGPKAIMSDWVLVHFGQPDSPQTFRMDAGGHTLLRPHLVVIQGDLWLTVHLMADHETRLLGVRLGGLESRELTPAAAYQDFSIDGVPGGAFPSGEYADLYLPAGSRRLAIGEWDWKAKLVSDVVLPEQISFLPRDRVVLSAANGELRALISIDTRVRKGADGYSPVHVYERQRRAWHSIEIPGGSSALRAFGGWLCAHIRYDSVDKPSPGAGQRRQGLSLTGPGFDAYATDLGVYQPGLIWLYHVPTRRRIVEETGQGDTAVLWVEDGHVLYRCDRALYEARIDGTRLRNHRKLIERDFIADVHGVFYGPPSPPPPDPPWAAFKDYEK